MEHQVQVVRQERQDFLKLQELAVHQEHQVQVVLQEHRVNQELVELQVQAVQRVLQD